MATRKYYRYLLRDGPRIVYVGITDDAERRRAEHEREGKEFTAMSIQGPVVTENTARKWEQDTLEQYRRNHGGRNPKYNQTDQG